MKKTCGALVIGLLITTNAFAGETVSQKDKCSLVNIYIKQHPNFKDKKYQNFVFKGVMCELIYEFFKTGYDSGEDFGIDSMRGECQRRLKNCQEGLARSTTTAPSYDVKQQPENSISKELDRQEQIQDERIKEHYRNEVMKSFNK